MITMNVKNIASKRGIANANQLRERLQVSPNVAARLWKEDLTQMDFGVLDRLCRALSATPGDLLLFADESNETDGKRRKRGKK